MGWHYFIRISSQQILDLQLLKAIVAKFTLNKIHRIHPLYTTSMTASVNNVCQGSCYPAIIRARHRIIVGLTFPSTSNESTVNNAVINVHLAGATETRLTSALNRDSAECAFRLWCGRGLGGCNPKLSLVTTHLGLVANTSSLSC